MTIPINLNVAATVDGTPAQFSGLTVWARADQYSLTSGKVSTWTDLSGKGNHLTQPLAGGRATPVANQINGKPILRFNGSYYAVTFGGGAIAQPNYFFCVIKCSNATSVPALWDGVAAGHAALVYGAGATTLDLTNNTVQISSPAVDLTSFSTLIVTHNGVSSNIEQNGTSKVTGDAGANTITGITLGENFAVNMAGLQADIAEFGVITGAMTAGELASLRGYLRAAYGTW